MEQMPSNKYSLAWFKLAEFVTRGEKERALGIYKLLVHAIDDQAFAVQLEGDLLLAFEDQSAIDYYLKAAHLYEKADRTMHAIAVYEQILILKPQVIEYRTHLIKLYQSLSNDKKIINHIERLFELLLQAGSVDQAIELLKNYQESDYAYLYQKLVLHLVRQKNPDMEQLISYTHKAIDQLLISENKHALQQFLSELQQLNKQLYQKVHAYMQDGEL